MKTNILISILCFLMIPYMARTERSIAWIAVNNSDYYAIDGEQFTNKTILNTFLQSNNVLSYKQALPFSKKTELLRIHEIELSENVDLDEFFNSLTKEFTGIFDNLSKIEIVEENVQVFDPIDYMYTLGWLWHLEKIQANLAWDITKGDPNIKIAIIDVSPDITHPDLASEILLPHDPYSNDNYSCINNPSLYHGTTVASFASGETTEPGQTSVGQLASVGFHTKLISYKTTGSVHLNLQKALHASTVMGADVIVSCAGWGSLSCSPTPGSYEFEIVNEIIENGTVIVMPAGNGLSGHHCGPHNNYGAFYPFHPSYNESIIIVSSTGSNDKHQAFDSNGNEITHSHFLEVDICAPGYHMMGAKQTDCNPSGWPYWNGYGGTSFSSPIVAGAAALIKSINQDFTPAEVKYFITSTADPIADDHNYPGMLGSGRLNVFKAVRMAHEGAPVIVNSNETWNDNRTIIFGLEVTNNAHLTINSTILLSRNAKIVIHPGSKLTLNGSTLTSLDNHPWQGIYVEGDRTLPQTFANQGAVILQNGAIIENAVNAISLHADGDTYWTNGGIVQATNSTFRNNWRDIEFMSYQNINSSGTEINTISYLTGCTFTMDDNSLFDIPIQNVTLWSVKGVVFTNCDFSDTRTGLVYEGSETNARDGIYAYTATFKALGCDFTNLKYGIYNTSVDASHTFTAAHCEFDCFRGLYNNSAVNPSIYSNQFTVRPGYMFNDDMGSCSDTYGLYVENSHNFNIHDNIFTSSGTSAPYCNSFGLIVRHSRSIYKKLYRNTFSGFYNGIQAIGNNKGSLPEDGLEIRCNFFINDHQMDIYVTSPGIRFFQGLQDEPKNNELAGNLFSDNTWYMNSGDLFRYYHHDPASHPNILPDYYNPNKIAMYESIGQEFFFDTIVSCPLPARSRSLEMLVTDITDAKTQYDETDQLLQSYVDDGNTDLMTQQVEMTGDYDAWQTYQYLMQTSPYLSEEVLSTLSEREDGFNQAMIRDVLVENPQAAKSQEVTEALDNRINQLPAYMRWQIRNGLYQFGQKEIMELHKAAQKIRFDEAVNEMIFHKMEGTEGWENTPLLSELLADVDDASFQFLRSEFAFDENGYDAAITTLNQIATDFALADAADQQKWNEYMQYYSVMNALEQANDTLTEAQLQQLMALTEASPRVAGKAIAYLMHHNMLDYQEPIYYPEEEMEMKSGTVEMQPEIMVMEESTTDKFLIFPNPALDYITLSWCSDAAIAAGTSVDFFDSRGVLVHKEPLTSNCDQVILQVTNWKSGTYTATFTGSATRSVTFVVGR